MTTEPIAVVVLAAGEGTRMRSGLPKVMHAIAGRPMIAHVMATAAELGPERTVVVLGPDMGAVAEAVAPAAVAVQDPPLGTGHAVMAAGEALAGFSGDVLVLYGDTPLIRAQSLRALLAARRAEPRPAVVVLGFRPGDPGEYGRLIVGPEGQLEAIVEARDASPEQRESPLCNAGPMVIDGGLLPSLLEAVGTDNAKGEQYLTDVVAVARARGLTCTAVEGEAEDALGVNSQAELAHAEALMQGRLRGAAMEGGATLIAPETVHLAYDTELGRDSVVGPYVVFGPGVRLGEGVRVHAFSHLEGARLEEGASVGPFARLRPGAEIGAHARVGNFVEVKAATVEAGAKANHLTYLGDARVGAGANIGAGTITCNYDGFVKAFTDIGAGAFIGSNTALVAPVKVGEGAVVGAGSVIVRDVPADALAVARGEQSNLERGAERLRRRKGAAKAGKRKAG